MAGYRLGVDIGGTFTDFVLEEVGTGRIHLGKTLTTPTDPSDAVIEGLAGLLKASGCAAEGLTQIVHGTTLGTNSVIERTGAKTGLLTTEGFRDVLAIRREARYDYYDLQIELPEALVPRPLRRGVAQRIDRDGNEAKPLDRDQLAAEIAALKEAGVASIAVCYLHAHKNGAHEASTAEAIAAMAPGIYVSLSSEVAPEIREYERTSTTVINAYLQPLMDRYLARLAERVAAMGVRCDLHLMLSSGLLTTSEQARRFPTRLIESGPAGGVKLAERFGRLTGQSDVIAFDMGGTTAKASLIHHGEVAVAREFEVARLDRFKRGSGFPVRVPCVEIEEIGTGGGSIAWIDRLGQLQVGPRSAGAMPGPACYGRGGTKPTVTDADLVLGYLDPGYFLGGEMTLDIEASRRAIEEHVATPLGLSVTQAAWGIHRVANEDMANAFRIHAMEHGRDPSRYALLSFGGAGPVHAYGVARILRSPAVLAPSRAGVASALGFLVAPIASEAVRAYVTRLDRIDYARLRGLFAEMEAKGREFLASAGVAQADMVVTRSADMQYVGQMHDISVPMPDGDLTEADYPRLRAAFFSRYRDLFHRTAELQVEALNWRVTVSAPPPPLDLVLRQPAAGAAQKGERLAYFPEAEGYVLTPVYNRYALAPGAALQGPAIVEERESTLVVGPGATVRVDEYGTLVVQPPAARAKEAA
ncbi:hydantoinase/oxoprolinase family protein [Falsiroseomonas sp. HW251]|uniref:hydantoinase/oxoprolinase family protein n=1 Tax=Falsiroseomonas sp. HW251 TaxID=3390998 RepID=UPI003D32421F